MKLLLFLFLLPFVLGVKGASGADLLLEASLNNVQNGDDHALEATNLKNEATSHVLSAANSIPDWCYNSDFYGAGWLNIDYPTKKPKLITHDLWIYLSGKAFISPTWWHCCDGTAEELTGVKVTCKNCTTGVFEAAYQTVKIGWLVPLYDHEWSCSVDLLEGDNFIAVTARDPSGNWGRDVIKVTYSRIMLLAPNGGEVIPSGSLYPIQWDAPIEAVNFKLKYSMDNGLTWTPIPKTGDFIQGTSYDWIVPKPWGNKKKCFVKVTGYDSFNVKVGADKSDAPFTIEVVKLTSPNGGMTYTSGDPLTIRWTTNATKRDIAKVKLYYTKDGGITWNWVTTIKGSNPGSYDGLVPIVIKTKNNCKIKVELRDEVGNILGKDASDDYFTINPSGVLLK